MWSAVFVPTTPNPTTGFLQLVRADQVTPAGISIEEGRGTRTLRNLRSSGVLDVLGQDRVHGYKEIPKPAFLECDLSDRANVDIKRYSDMRDVDLTVELGNGKMFVMQGAWCVTPPELDTAEGQYPVRFEAVEAEEITVSA